MRSRKGKEARIASVQDAFNLYLGQNGTPGEVAAVVRTAQATNTSVQAAVLGSQLFLSKRAAERTQPISRG